MKHILYILIVLCSISVSAQVPNLTWGKKVWATSQFQLGNELINSISLDSTDASKSDLKLITEKAIKAYVRSKITTPDSLADGLGTKVATAGTKKYKINLDTNYLKNLIDSSIAAAVATGEYLDSNRIRDLIYHIADSLVSAGGGGTLQTVTTAGDTTTNNIILNYGGAEIASLRRSGNVGNVSVADRRGPSGNGYNILEPSLLSWAGPNGSSAELYMTTNPTQGASIKRSTALPVTSDAGSADIKTLAISVNGNYADAYGNITIPAAGDFYGENGTIGTGRVATLTDSLTIRDVDKEFGIKIVNKSGDTLNKLILGTETGSSGTHMLVDDYNSKVRVKAGEITLSGSVIADSIFAGKVGLGTTTPTAPLHVVGGIICDSTRIGSDWFYTKKITIDSSGINNGNTVAIEAISEPGIGKAIDLISATYYYNYGATPYSSESELYLYMEEDAGQNIGSSPNFTLFTYNIGGKFYISPSYSFRENIPIYLKFSSDNSDGDGTVVVYIYYRIVTI